MTRQETVDLAQQTKKQIRQALAKHHPDVGGDRVIYDQIKPLFDQVNDILHQVDNCPPVMLNPLTSRLNALQGQLRGILAKVSQPQPIPVSQPKTGPKPQPTTPAKPQPIPVSQPKTTPRTPATPQPPKPQPTTPAKPQPPKTATPPSLKPSLDPTKQLYSQLGDITEFLSKTLFGNVLPLPVIRLQVKPNMRGYMTNSKNWQYGQTQIQTYEMGLNPVYFQNHTLLEVFNVIAHELTHEYCSEVYGSATTYHDANWQKEAVQIGLQPVGKGVKVSTTVVKGGLVELAYQEFMRQNKRFSIDWFNINMGQPVTPATGGTSGGNSKAVSKQKFTCPTCGQNAWAKPTAKLVCGDCFEKMI